MGAKSSRSQPAVGHLFESEIVNLKKLFQTIRIDSCKNDKSYVCSYCDFQRHCERHMDDWLARRITDKLETKSSIGEKSVVTLDKFLLFASTCLKGEPDEKVDQIFMVAREDSANEASTVITTDEMLQYTRGLIESYMKSMETSPASQSWSGHLRQTSETVGDLSEFILMDLLYPGMQAKDILKKEFSRKRHTKEEVAHSLTTSSLFNNLYEYVFNRCFQIEVDSFVHYIPRCQFSALAKNADTSFTLLDISRIMFLNSQLSADFRNEWRLLYSTSIHGESFSKLLSSILDKGATLLLIKDEKGRIFGAFASENWAVGPKFFGNSQSFLFHIAPKCVIYSPTGYNDNYQYLNIQQQTLPNGLGFGGKLEYFGLWLDAEFGKGKCSPSCTTYSCPQLSTFENFTIHTLEVWGVGPEPVKDENERGQSILDKDPEAKAMLEMIGKPQGSEGYRDEPKESQ